MGAILVSCRNRAYADAHYLPPLRQAGWAGAVRFLDPAGPGSGLDGITGLLLTGGLDIHPRRWDPDERVHPAAEVDEDRDAWEIPVIRKAWQLNLPILGICRGEQILNVALGGTMVQDIPDHFGCPQDYHRHGSAKDPGELHPVEVVPGTLLARLLGAGPVPVNSRHHQAVLGIAPGLRVCARQPDTQKDGESLVEGLEAAAPDRWVLGVQWHPEDLAGREDAAGLAARALFEAFARRLGA